MLLVRCLLLGQLLLRMRRLRRGAMRRNGEYLQRWPGLLLGLLETVKLVRSTHDCDCAGGGRMKKDGRRRVCEIIGLLGAKGYLEVVDARLVRQRWGMPQ